MIGDYYFIVLLLHFAKAFIHSHIQIFHKIRIQFCILINELIFTDQNPKNQPKQISHNYIYADDHSFSTH